MSKSTNKELVIDLESRNTNHQYDEIIAEAKAGEYHDFKNKKYVCGKVELVNKLDKFPKLADIREAVINGEYDETPDKEDKELMRKELIEDLGEEGANKMMKDLGLT